MHKTEQLKNDEQKYAVDKFQTSHRLDLNELLERRKREKALDKKNNIFIFSGTAVVAAVVLIILSL